jgi:phosphatidylinositol transfer protein SFH5
MELGIRKLNLGAVSSPIPDDGPDPYQMVQVHDYVNVSFFRMDPHVKAASRETIQTFSMAYPELLSHKFFVNVPSIMGWVFSAMKLFLAPATLRKFHPMASGTGLANELKSVAASLPLEYGGKGASVKTGLTVKLSVVDVPKASEAPQVAEMKAQAPLGDVTNKTVEPPVAVIAPGAAAEESVPEVKDVKVEEGAKAAA